MARTSTPRTDLPKSTPTAQPAGTTIDPTNGHVVLSNIASGATTIIDINSTFAGNKTFTIKAGTPGANGWPAGAQLGDLVVTLNAARAFVPIESHRFLQPDGTILIDCQAGATGVIRVYTLPH